jgi:predicted  nucleic acid-binding Zn-ribbon protein
MTESLEEVFKLNTQLSLDGLTDKIKNVQTPLTDCFLIVKCITTIQIKIEPYTQATKLFSDDQIKINLEDTKKSISQEIKKKYTDTKLENPKIYITYNEALNFEEKDLPDIHSHFFKNNFDVEIGQNGFQNVGYKNTIQIFEIVSFEKTEKTCEQKQEDKIQTQEDSRNMTLADQIHTLQIDLNSDRQQIKINNEEIASITTEIQTNKAELEKIKKENPDLQEYPNLKDEISRLSKQIILNPLEIKRLSRENQNLEKQITTNQEDLIEIQNKISEIKSQCTQQVQQGGKRNKKRKTNKKRKNKNKPTKKRR